LSKQSKVPETCPHCGRNLSPWEQVLLNVDRALMCKGCWYRIVLDAFDNPTIGPETNQSQDKDDET